MVTEYANTNVDELFAESTANYVVGKGLPDYLKDLWTRTLANVQGKKVIVHEEE